MDLTQAHEAAAKLLMGDKAADGGAGEGANEEQPAGPAGGVADIEAQVEDILSEINGVEPVAAQDPAKKKAAPANRDDDAKAALRAANERNREAAEALRRADEIAHTSQQTLDGLRRLAMKNKSAALEALLSMGEDKADGGQPAVPSIIEGETEDGNRVRVRLPKEIVDKIARFDAVESRLGQYENHSFAQGVRTLVAKKVAETGVFDEMGVADDVTNSLVAQIANDGSVRANNLSERVEELVALAATRSTTIRDTIVNKYIKGKARDSKNAAPAMRGSGGAAPRTGPAQAPKLGKGPDRWNQVHQLAAKVNSRLREAGLTK
jgi:hypothetical protein